MGAGVALAFKTRFPQMFKDYKHACEEGEMQPGKLHIRKSHAEDWIINFPTKRHWRDKSRHEEIKDGLVDYLKDKGRIRDALLALGCGHGARLEQSFRPDSGKSKTFGSGDHSVRAVGSDKIQLIVLILSSPPPNLITPKFGLNLIEFFSRKGAPRSLSAR